MKPYFGYIRVSTQKQGATGSSLQEQRSAIEAYATRHQLVIADWFEERESAAKRGRRIFARMLSELDRGRAVGIIVHKIDRSARNLQDWAGLGELIDRGVDVRFAHENLDLQSRGGRLTADLLAVISADFIRNLKDEVRKGFYGRLKQGFYPLPAPLGYLNNGKAKPKTFDPVAGPLVRQMFELYASGRYTLDSLRVEMRQRGLKRGGQALSKTGIAHVLHNKFYVGIIHIQSTGEVFQGNHEALVSKQLFDVVQARLAGRTYAHVLKHGYAYRRLISCAACGRSLTGERQKGQVYYRCHSKPCRGTSIREDAVDAQLQHEIACAQLNDAELQILERLATEASEAAAAARVEARSQLERALSLCQSRLIRLTDIYVDGELDQEVYNERKITLLEERAELQGKLARDDDQPFADQLLKKFELGKTAQLRFETQNADEKRETVKFFSSNLAVNGKELGIGLRFPFDEVAKMRKSEDCGPSCNGLRTFTRAELKRLLRQVKSQRPDVPDLLQAA